MNEKTKNILSIVVDYIIDFIIFFVALLITDKLPLHAILEILLGAIIAVALIALKENLAMKFVSKKNDEEASVTDANTATSDNVTTDTATPTDTTTEVAADTATEASTDTTP